MNKEIEKAFSQITLVVLGRSLDGVKSYERWLEARVRMPQKGRSILSGKVLYHPPLAFSTGIQRSLKLDEWQGFGEKELGRSQALSLNLENAAQKLRPIAYTTPEVVLGKNESVEESSAYGYSSYCYRGDSFVYRKFCAYCLWPRESEYVFGSDNTFASRFCLKCYYSVNLTRCFEVSNSSSSSDCLFCHNVENCMDCMFCFNVKAKRFAIGNVEYKKEEYLHIKKLVLEEIASKLENDKKLGLSIFNVGCPK